MRVLLLAPQPFYQERGTPIAVRLALEALSRKLNLSTESAPLIDLLAYAEGADITIPGVRILRIPQPRWLRAIRPGISWQKLLCDVVFAWTTFQLLWRARAEHQPYAVVHAVEESVFIAWLAKQIFGTPYIYDMDSSLALQLTEKWWILKPLLPILRGLERLAVRGSIAVAPVCDALEAIAAQHGSPRTVLLRDISLLPPAAPANLPARPQVFGAAVTPTTPVILYVGNLETYQGIDLLLEAFTQVRNHHSTPHLVVIGGTAPTVAQYQRRATQLGCAQQTSFLGPKPVTDLTLFLSLADILVSPRIQGNNTPMKVYSYLHSGKALVATDLPTHRQVLDSEVAVLVPPEPAGFARGLTTLLENPQLRGEIGARAYQRAERLYTREAFEAQFTALYEYVQGAIAAELTHTLSPQQDGL
jgi:glycosyltransferase involved in cell wall biosynthesis